MTAPQPGCCWSRSRDPAYCYCPWQAPGTDDSALVGLYGSSTVTASRTPRIATIGKASWHRLSVVDSYPARGGRAIVQAEHSQPGGTASTAVALARLGAEVSFAGIVGNDAEGAALRAFLDVEGIDSEWLAVRQGQPTDTSTIITAGGTPDRTVLSRPGAHIVRGDRLDIAAAFDHDVVFLDIADAPLRRLLTDLPAHTLPRTRLVGSLSDLVNAGLPDALEVAMRHDVLLGAERDVEALVDAATLDEAVATIQSKMRGSNLRSLVVFRGARGCRICLPAEMWDIPGFPVARQAGATADTAFTAGIIYGVARRWPWPEVGRFANAAEVLSIQALDLHDRLPSLDEVRTFLEHHPTGTAP